ncbi:hypothetical protein MRX96_013720 [Rhipicephalus microplus]
MSRLACPSCGHESHIFGKDGASELAREMALDILGDVPLDIEIRESSDNGQPIVVSNGTSPQAQVYKDMAQKIIQKLPV